MSVYIDTNIPSPAFIRGLAYIKNCILKPPLKLETIDIHTLFKHLRAYRTQKQLKHLSYGSIKYIFSIIDRVRPDIKKHAQFKILRNKLWRDWNTTAASVEIYTPLEEAAIRKTIEYFITQFVALSNNKVQHRHKVLYETGLAILLTLSTNLRISELLQLTYDHLAALVRGLTINIRIKKRLAPVHILVNRNMLQSIIKSLDSGGSGTQHVLSLSAGTINQCIRHHILSHLDISTSTRTFGIQAIRKINTTILIESGSIELAQVFNRHRSSTTTNTYYNTKNYFSRMLNNVYTS
ncbi:VLF-1 [Crangon crangon nudivirus]|uniref:VLF-1 n=1 Tax=Crangon crangon nudivirus TaxID=2880838 RepID=A0AAE9BYP3_9VIRU|nr:VLF-1 [Crangon crangon nudivirus]UBZ25544.1 VLF-1 [Crangon crangon nudivirus]